MPLPLPLDESGRDRFLAALLWLNAGAFLLAVVINLPFSSWIVFDAAAVLVCGIIGFVRKIRLLQIVVGVIIVGVVFRFTLTVWVAIDLFIVGSCVYVGCLFWMGKHAHGQNSS